MTVPAALRTLEKIEMIRQFDDVYRLDHAVTATQKTIPKAFGVDANDVKGSASQISEQLRLASKKKRSEAYGKDEDSNRY
ncbi:hypothetical protein LQZ18_01875 [Lachnospiraceae bacterium ZAX-1]